MAKLITFDNLSTYDGLIKSLIQTEDAKSIKSISYDASTRVVSFFKTEDGSGLPYTTITIPDTSNFIEKIANATAGDFVTVTAQGTLVDAGATISSEKITGLGTAAAADIATSAITEESTDDNLVSAAQVSAFVAAEIAGLEGAMHFRGVIERQTGETDAQAIARVITDPEAGDVVVMSDNAKEYVYDGTSWKEVGDETEFVKKTTTIAGVDLQDNITKTELLTALNVEDGAQVNVLEGVKLNGNALTVDANKAVDIVLDGDDVVYEQGTGGAADITVKDAIDDLYDQIGSGGTVDEKIAAAINALDATESQTAGTDGLALSISEVDGVITSISGSIAANTYDAYGAGTAAATAAVEALDATPSQSAGTDGLSLNLTQVDGVVTAISGSIAANTYEPYGSTSSAIANLDATETQTAGADGLSLSITETDGVITAISGSIASGTYLDTATYTMAETSDIQGLFS